MVIFISSKYRFANFVLMKMLIRINNTSEFPIDVFGLTHRKKKNIAELDFPKRILSLQTDTVSVKIPRSFENLFVSKKKKVVGFNLAKHIYDLNLSYLKTYLSPHF